jgi:hypothetical protein
MTNKPTSLNDITTELQEQTAMKRISVGEVMDAFEHRGFGPLLIVPCLFLILPTGAIPGVPLICGVFMALVCLQMMLGYSNPWIPKRIRKISFEGRKLDKALEKVKPYLKKLDPYIKPRLIWFVTPIAKRGISFICFLLSIAIIPAALVPFGGDPFAIAIFFFALGFRINDGLVTVIGLGITLAAVLITLFFL